jgi:glycosyltransferase involved in cell wall biosynthesis
MPNLTTILAPLRRLQAEVRAPLRVVGVGEVALPGVEVEVRQWSAATEVSELQDCEIGLVPLTDLPWNRWKFFFKTVQYMAVGLPVVARRLGSNSEIITHGVNGFLVESNDEWYDCLRALVTNRDLRRRMGEAARETIVTRYSTQIQMPRMVSIFEHVLAGPARAAGTLQHASSNSADT